MADVGALRIDVELENLARPGARLRLTGLLVDTDSTLSWVPAVTLESLGVAREKLVRFRQATGAVVERWTGSARIHAAGTATADDVVFGEPGDLLLLGARTLEGLNVRIDPMTKRLVDAGPAPAAAAA
jgi:predicted aspartyl protease